MPPPGTLSDGHDGAKQAASEGPRLPANKLCWGFQGAGVGTLESQAEYEDVFKAIVLCLDDKSDVCREKAAVVLSRLLEVGSGPNYPGSVFVYECSAETKNPKPYIRIFGTRGAEDLVCPDWSKMG